MSGYLSRVLGGQILFACVEEGGIHHPSAFGMETFTRTCNDGLGEIFSAVKYDHCICLCFEILPRGVKLVTLIGLCQIKRLI